MRHRLISVATAFVVSSTLLVSAAAQTLPVGPPPNIADASPDLTPPMYAASVTGTATLTRDGASAPLDLNAPVVDGDRLRTSAGRVQLAGTPGTRLFLDDHTVLDVVSTERVRAVEGRVRLVVTDVSQPPPSLDVPGGTVRVNEPGSCTVEVGQGARGDEVRVLVTEGSAQFESDAGPLLVKSGELMTYRAGSTPELAAGANASRAAADLQRWADAQVARQDGSAEPASSSHLPEDLADYSATLEQYGQWDQDPTYGDVWYPTVSVEWQPYSDGRWDRVGRYGWFWVGTSPWAWPTHHYGRWGQQGGRWFWRPDNRWAPSWVAWAIAPGYVGWCPLGPDNHPTRGFGGAGSRVTYYRGGRAVGSDWQGWNLVPREAFDSRQAVTRALVDPATIPHEVASSFVTQRVPPPTWGQPARAVPRGTVPGGTDAGAILRRGTSPANMTGPDRYPAYGIPSRGATTSSPYERAQRYMNPDRTDGPASAGQHGSDGDERPGALTHPSPTGIYRGYGGPRRVDPGAATSPATATGTATGDARQGIGTTPPSHGASGTDAGSRPPAGLAVPRRSPPAASPAATPPNPQPPAGGLGAPSTPPPHGQLPPAGSVPRPRAPSGHGGD